MNILEIIQTSHANVFAHSISFSITIRLLSNFPLHTDRLIGQHSFEVGSDDKRSIAIRCVRIEISTRLGKEESIFELVWIPFRRSIKYALPSVASNETMTTTAIVKCSCFYLIGAKVFEMVHSNHQRNGGDGVNAIPTTTDCIKVVAQKDTHALRKNIHLSTLWHQL